MPSRADGAPRPRPALPPARGVALVALGGGLGALARTALGAALPAAEAAWPWAILVANLGGAFALALLLSAFAKGVIARFWVLPLVGTGVLGAFTTFSTVAFGLQRMAATGRAGLAVAYAAASLTGGLLAGVAGIVTARAWARRRGRAA